MTRDEALTHVKVGDMLRCQFYKSTPHVKVLDINPDAASQERITFKVTLTQTYHYWLDAGWFELPPPDQLGLFEDIAQ